MRLVLQRCARASVTVDSRVVCSSMGPCLVALVGLAPDDGAKEVAWAADRVLNVKLWADRDGRPWRCSAVDMDYDVLLVSQFTLFARLKGRRPDFSGAMVADDARKLYAAFVERVRQGRSGVPNAQGSVLDGEFGALMAVDLVNDGPVTLVLDSPSTTTSLASAEQPAREGPGQGRLPPGAVPGPGPGPVRVTVSPADRGPGPQAAASGAAGILREGCAVEVRVERVRGGDGRGGMAGAPPETHAKPRD